MPSRLVRSSPVSPVRSASSRPSLPWISSELCIPPCTAQELSDTSTAPSASSSRTTASSSSSVFAPCSTVRSSAETARTAGRSSAKRSASIPWQPMSISAPPPASAASKNQGEYGPPCFSTWRAQSTRPSAPERTSSRARRNSGAKHRFSA